LLSANLSTADVAGPPHGIVEVHWDNPTITLTYLVNNATYANRTNPVNYSQIGNVYVNITSDFYDAWADYIRSVSSTGIVSEDPKNHTVGMALTVYPSYEGIMNSYIPTTIAFRGLAGSNPTPLSNFSFKLKPAGHNLDWDIRAGSDDSKKLIFYLKEYGNSFMLQIGYQEAGQSAPVEAWQNTLNFTVQPDGYVYIDLLNKSNNFTYTKNGVGSTSGQGCTPSQIAGGGSQFSNPAFSWTDRVINTTYPYNTQSFYNVTQHYIQEMAQNGDFSFSQCYPVGQNIYPSSTMYINYYSPGGLVYLHITDNKADVGIS
ncbi:MAG: hypothetical protein O8C68_05840, partial [Candidatus Methanoperedens sp.]|nr:hypothetical protein [Candidatus Methanoperedens sp.]MCZ7395322.1 hypothetical protein [Candidatus Methanoperedens sp.]